MLPRITIAGVVLFILGLLLLFLSFLAIFSILKLGPIRPSPEALVFINDEEFHTFKGPITVNVKKDEVVEVKVQVYYRDQPVPPGEFTYQWCFTPPINGNRHCADSNFKTEANSDYIPKNLGEQKLKIIISHDFLRTLTIPIVFNPEE